jgi:hypothetical protein
MTPNDTKVRRGERGTQRLYVWLMTLTAHAGKCTYCATAAATTLDHEQPIAADGADTWWNFLPACQRCNLWNSARTAREWYRDQELHRQHPEVEFGARRMSLRMFSGFLRRVEKVQREIADPDRQTWFRHHYGQERYRNKRHIWSD